MADNDGVGTGPVFLYDGDCGFCGACARWLARHVPSPVRIVPWQRTDVAALGLTAADCAAAVQLVTWDGAGHPSRAAGPSAVAGVLRASRWHWRVTGRLLATRPALALAWPVYRWVARHRHRLPGGPGTCAGTPAGGS